MDPGPINDDVWVVIPVFNEAQVLEQVVRQTLAVFPNVVCVDDGSGDGSVEAVLRTDAHLVRHPVNLGQGAALQTGLSYARAQPGAQYFVMFDADGQHRLEDASTMVEVARSGAADVVLGTRFAENADSVPLLKRIVLRTAVLLSPAGRKLKLTDAHNGLRVLTRPVADHLYITMNGMAHASEIVSYLGRSSWRVREVPVTIRYTEYSRGKGQSLLNGVNILFDLSIRQRGADAVLIQILLLVAVLGLLFLFVRSSGAVYVQASKRIALVLFALANIYAVMRPDDLTTIARTLGVGRGTDLVLYALVVAFMAGMFSFYQRFRVVDRRYTELARTVAIREAEVVNRERGITSPPIVPTGEELT